MLSVVTIVIWYQLRRNTNDSLGEWNSWNKDLRPFPCNIRYADDTALYISTKKHNDNIKLHVGNELIEWVENYGHLWKNNNERLKYDWQFERNYFIIEIKAQN